LGGQQLADDLWNGAEAYLEMWERADGIKTPGCGKTTIRLAWSWQTLLKRAGQPQQRGTTWTYCHDVAVLGAAGEGAPRRDQPQGTQARRREGRPADQGHGRQAQGQHRLADPRRARARGRHEPPARQGAVQRYATGFRSEREGCGRVHRERPRVP